MPEKKYIYIRWLTFYPHGMCKCFRRIGMVYLYDDSQPSICAERMSAPPTATTPLGHEDAFPRPGLSDRSRFSQETFARAHGNGRDPEGRAGQLRASHRSLFPLS